MKMEKNFLAITWRRKITGLKISDLHVYLHIVQSVIIELFQPLIAMMMVNWMSQSMTQSLKPVEGKQKRP
jgi:hypothetical protein